MTKNTFDAEVFRKVDYVNFKNKGREFRLSTQPYLDIVINDHCNAKCKFCIGHLVHKRMWPKLFNQEKGIRYAIEKMGVNEVLLLGGEPTINDDLFDYVDYLRKNFNLRKICTTTNGHRMTKEDGYAERLFSSGITHLNLSYMSVNPDTQKFLSGTNVTIDHRALRRFKDLADKHNVHLRINNNVFRNNHDDAESMINFYNEVEPFCDSVKFSPLLKTDSFSTVNEVTEFNRDNILSPKEYDDLWHELEAVFDVYPIVRNKYTFGFVEYSMILLPVPIVLNYNQHGQLRQRVLKGFINNLKMLTTGDLSLSWNREEADHFIDVT